MPAPPLLPTVSCVGCMYVTETQGDLVAHPPAQVSRHDGARSTQAASRAQPAELRWRGRRPTLGMLLTSYLRGSPHNQSPSCCGWSTLSTMPRPSGCLSCGAGVRQPTASRSTPTTGALRAIAAALASPAAVPASPVQTAVAWLCGALRGRQPAHATARSRRAATKARGRKACSRRRASSAGWRARLHLRGAPPRS